MASETSSHQKPKVNMVNFNSLEDFSLLSNTAIIDLRDSDLFCKKHIINSFNLIASEVAERMHELPQSSKPISIIGGKKEILWVTDFLTSKGYEVVFKIDFDEFEQRYRQQNDWFSLGHSVIQLWQPSSVVQSFLKLTHQIGNKKGIDLACGSGRDAVFMALNNWKMTAVDHLESALARATQLAKSNSCELETVQFDLEPFDLEPSDLNQFDIDQQASFSPFPSEWLGQFDLVIVVRYLHRPLLKHLDQLLNPKGFIVYQTFMHGCEKYGSPKNPRYLLQENELANAFPNYRILLDSIQHLADGRPTNAFIAQKPDRIKAKND